MIKCHGQLAGTGGGINSTILDHFVLSAYQENNLLTMCKNFEKKLGDIDPWK